MNGSTEIVLGAATSQGCDPVIHVSTMSVIFPPTGSKLSGDDLVHGGGNLYNASKAVAEEYAGLFKTKDNQSALSTSQVLRVQQI